jgi:hypothetical protein
MTLRHTDLFAAAFVTAGLVQQPETTGEYLQLFPY